ncbi:sensor histidine kinase [Aneurinibacillus uraniidurans]|uniref:sensor histidine kinase n=1 Tax=Aneurinibacillus uraniidurans TaxID=2966586 RepID=UPI00234AAE1B|nr:sensor histidine kinase [Aneurinibacillus sp. B1]WCN38765.1 sensor histidine kinase [Aneurinibacillus sp. B1]
MKSKFSMILLLVGATMLFGELKFQPFHSEFRISFGSAFFFFALIWVREIPILLTSVLTGSAVVGFRIFLDFIFPAHPFSVHDSVLTHLPTLAFYMAFGLIMWFGRAWRYLQQPIRLAMIGVAADFLGNVTELIVRKSLTYGYFYVPVVWQDEYFLLILAFVRSFLIVGFFNIIEIRHLREIHEEQQLRFEKLLMIGSDLHVEALYLKKMMGHIEQVTRNGYHLYRDVKQYEAYGVLPKEELPLSRRALFIAEEVHEIKKDSQRILSGMSKIIQQEEAASRLGLRDILRLVLNANDKYARMLGKKIQFFADIQVALVTEEVYSLLSVLNNLLSNAVEAIEEEGRIMLRIRREGNMFMFAVTDSGSGIAEGEEDYIFNPGYTTKYDEQGNASTGIGLAHARHIVEQLGGTLTVNRGQAPEVTTFIVRLPVEVLRKREEETV